MLLALLLASPALVHPAPQEELGWPRELLRDGNRLVIHQPQLTAWEDLTTLRASMAVAIQMEGEEQPTFGVARFAAQTSTNMHERVVVLSDLTIEELVFGGDDVLAQTRLQALFLTSVPSSTVEVSLDRILEGMADVDIDLPEVEVETSPPDIFYSDVPAILVQFLGAPEFEMVEGTGLLVAANTNWDVFMDKDGAIYLLDGESWLTAPGLEAETWQAAQSLPEGLSELPEEGFEEVRQRIPGTPATSVPRVFVHDQPAELIVTEGAPERRMVPNVALLSIENTDSDLFFIDDRYYVLLAGRWFFAPELEGPWYSAWDSLPSEFAQIPEDHPKAHVLASVPGTADAKAAAIEASLPYVGTVSRDATVVVTYDGEPIFELIEGTEVRVCTNTAFEVFEVNGLFYCCHRGVWFQSDAPRGEWVVSVEVPDAIFEIPPESAHHDVTYVDSGEYDDGEVEMVCYPGYWGTYVYWGRPVYGGGWYLRWRRARAIHWSRHPAHHHGYGCCARYSRNGGGFVRAGRRYGPYGGCGPVRRYDAGRGAWGHGTQRSSAAFGSDLRGSYAPGKTDAPGRSAGRSPYAGADTVRSRGGDAAVRTGARARRDTPSSRRTTRPTFTPTTATHGDLYAGRGGDVLRRDSSGGWSRSDGKSWKPIQRDASGAYIDKIQPSRPTNSGPGAGRTQRGSSAARRSAAPTSVSRAKTPQTRKRTPPGQRRGSTRSSGSTTRKTQPRSSSTSRGSVQQLEREHRSRQRGTQRAKSSSRGRSSAGRGRAGGGRR